MGRSGVIRVAAIGLAVLLVALVAVGIVATSDPQPPSSVASPDPGGTPAPGDGRETVPPPSAARLRVSIVSWNSYYLNSVDNVVRGFGAIDAAGGDVVGLQEQNSPAKRRELVRRLAPTWAFVGTQTRQPIAYRAADYQLLSSGVVKAHGPHLIEPGAGGTAVPTKWVVWAELRDVHTGAAFAVVGDHKIASVERLGHPREDHPIRLRLWHEEDRAVGRVIAQLAPLGIPIFKTADENLAARPHSAFGYDEIMAKRGFSSNWRVLGYPDRGTHGSRLIDYVWSDTRLAVPVRQRILGTYGSDHAILVVDLDNEKATRETRSSPAGDGAGPAGGAASGLEVSSPAARTSSTRW